MTEPAAGMTGLEQLSALMAGKVRYEGINKALDFDLVEVADGRAVFEGKPDERVYNPQGSVHGGYMATLLDSALGCAAHTKLKAGQGYTTLDLQIAFHRPMTKDTGTVRAEGKIVTFGRRAGFAEGRITDAAGKVYATGTATLMVFER